MFKVNRKNLIYSLILLVAFFTLLIGARTFPALTFGVVKVTSLPIRILSYPVYEIKKLLFYHRTFDEYKRLREETDVLKSRLAGLEEVILENARLEKLLKFKRELVYSSVVASVIGRDPSYWNSAMIIDKGSDDGLRQGMPVVNALGIVGKVAEVGRTKSKVILLTDPQFSVAALVQEPRENGLVSGTLQGVCRMRYLREDAQVKVGNNVITSRLSSSFPEGLLIGEVIAIKGGADGPSVECLIRPAAALSQLEEVLVVLN